MKRQIKKMVPKHLMLFRVYKLCTFLVLLVLTILPVAPVFADEHIPTEPEPPIEDTTEQELEELDTIAEEIPAEVETSLNEIVENQVDVEDIADTLVTPSSETDLVISHETETDKTIQTSGDVVDDVVVVEVLDTTILSNNEVQVDTEHATTSVHIEHSTTTEIQEELGNVMTETHPTTTPETTGATTTEPILNEPTLFPQEPDTIAPSTTVQIEDTNATDTVSQENIIYIQTPVGNSNQFVFSKNQCTLTGNGTFYCVNATNTPEVIHTDRVFSAPDESGDKEIYIESKGELHKVTDNAYDDESPYYDEKSDTIVWHRLIDGVQQIISYDVQSREEETITNREFNNMEPKRYGETIVWQGWEGDDWDIFLMSEDMEIVMLTENNIQDVGPSIHENHIVWQSYENNEWWVKVYDLKTQNTETIDSSEGASIENPRFVLVYDTKYDNGDVETRGYNLEDGSVVHLGSTPAPVPTEIPEPEQTGEKSALVNPANQIKSKTDEIDEDDATSTPPLPLPPKNQDDSDLAIPSFVGTSTTSDSDLEATPEYENGDDTPEISHIEDVVIPPFMGTASSSATTSDSQ